MKTLAIISQKGGVVATALAVEAERAGRHTAVLDLDPQASATFWKDMREADTPAVVTVVPSRIGHILKAAGENGCDLAIIDAPPFAKDLAYEAAQQADFILIPTRPAVLDVMAMTKTLELVNHYSKPSAVVLTFCPPPGRAGTRRHRGGDSEARRDPCPCPRSHPHFLPAGAAERPRRPGIRAGRKGGR